MQSKKGIFEVEIQHDGIFCESDSQRETLWCEHLDGSDWFCDLFGEPLEAGKSKNMRFIKLFVRCEKCQQKFGD